MTMNFLPRSLRRPLAPCALALMTWLSMALPTAALAQNTPGVAVNPQNILNLSASASVEASKDLIAIVFSTTKEGSDAASVQTALKQALDAALAEAKSVAKPGQIDVQTGNFALYPRNNAKSAISGWQGSAELLVKGKDIQGVAQLAGRISTLTVARVGYELSREVREQLEADVTRKAIARFSANATDMSKSFGFTGHSIREVHVSMSAPNQHQPMVQARASSMMSSDMALPTEAGKATVTATVNGSIQMK